MWEPAISGMGNAHNCAPKLQAYPPIFSLTPKASGSMWLQSCEVHESYYSVQGTTRSSSHLFLFMEESDSIKLISYEIPEGYDKKNFTYKMFKGADYDQLKCSAKFNPAFFRKSGDTWEGGSVSMFSPVLKFSLHEKKVHWKSIGSIRVHGSKWEKNFWLWWADYLQTNKIEHWQGMLC